MKPFLIGLLAGLCLLSAGCGKEATPPPPAAFYSLRDTTGKEIVLTKKPEKIVLLSPAFLNIMHAAGGDFVAYGSSPSLDAPDYAKGKVNLGYSYQINMEKLIGEKPDLVIGLKGLHNPLASSLEANHIPLMLLSISTEDEVAQAIEIMGDVSGHTEEGAKASKEFQKEIDALSQKVPDKGMTCAVIFGAAHAVMFAKEGTIATETAKILHFQNVFAKEGASEMHMMPFSMEDLMKKDPDILFLTTMVTPGQEKKVFEESLLNQPAWQELRAVKEGRVYFLPQTLFLSSPGIDYPKAIRCMAGQVYPEMRF